MYVHSVGTYKTMNGEMRKWGNEENCRILINHVIQASQEEYIKAGNQVHLRS